VGKSSFLKSVTRADVDVQPYAFTTKSLFVGHFDYKYLRFQAIDTPGILDHPLEEMNTIEMQSITAIAHLRSAILYFMDLSEQCGYTVSAQMQLFQSIKPLFANKLVFIVINKIDVMRPEDLDPETQAQLQALLKPGDVEMLQLSCATDEGVQEVKNAACERLIADRVAQKLKAGSNSNGNVGGRLGDVLARIHVARPLDGVVRESYIPEAVKQMKKYDKNDPERRKLARDIEEENGGAGVYNVDLKDKYLLENDEWKHDKIPEVFDGKNVYDFIDPDIEAKLAALEEEEEKLEGEGYYESDEDLEDAEQAETRMKADLIREKRQLIRNAAKMKKSLKNRAVIPRTSTKKNLTEMEDHLDSLGLDTTSLASRARSQSRGRSVLRSRSGTEDAMDVDSPDYEAKMRAKSRARSQSNRRTDGVTNEEAKHKAEKAFKISQRFRNRMARAGESDRHIPAAMPKHLVCLHLAETVTIVYLLTIYARIRASVVWAQPAVARVRPRWPRVLGNLLGHVRSLGVGVSFAVFDIKIGWGKCVIAEMYRLSCLGSNGSRNVQPVGNPFGTTLVDKFGNMSGYYGSYTVTMQTYMMPIFHVSNVVRRCTGTPSVAWVLS
jgi:nucleolar GTP-binding protein